MSLIKKKDTKKIKTGKFSQQNTFYTACYAIQKISNIKATFKTNHIVYPHCTNMFSKVCSVYVGVCLCLLCILIHGSV